MTDLIIAPALGLPIPTYDTPTDASATGVQDMPDTVPITTWNSGARHVKAENTRADIQRIIAKRPLMLGMQEMGEKSAYNTAARLLKDAGYTMGHTSDSHTPIACIGKPVRRGSFFLTPRTYVGPAGAGPSTLKAKYIEWQHIRYNSLNIIHGNVHLAPSIYIPVRHQLHDRQVARIIEWARAAKKDYDYVFLTGDFNALASQMPKLNNILQHNTPTPTHGRRAIDYVYGSVHPTGVTVIDTHSDHRALTAMATLKSKK